MASLVEIILFFQHTFKEVGLKWKRIIEHVLLLNGNLCLASKN